MNIAQPNDIRTYPAPEIMAYMEQQADLFEAALKLPIIKYLRSILCSCNHRLTYSN
jgi:hypothetical protein